MSPKPAVAVAFRIQSCNRKYGPVEWEIGARGKPYAKWAAEMAVGLETAVPWIMCIQKFGGPIPHFLGDLLKMWHLQFQVSWGNKFGRIAAGRFIATSDDYDAPLDEYGLLNEPKYGHLRDLHEAIKLSEPALVSSYVSHLARKKSRDLSVDIKTQAHVYSLKSGGCAAFLSNYGPTYSVRVTFQKMQYDLPPWSISILPDCRTAVYNTARISSQSSQMKMTPVGCGLSWESHTEETPSADDSDTLSTSGLWEQINVTSSDYLWYMTKIRFWRGLDDPMLTYCGNVKLRAGINKISMLSVAVGFPNVGLHFETWNAGVLGPGTLSGLNEGTRDLTKQRWANKVGLKGKTLSLCTLNGSSSVKWVKDLLLAQKQPVTLYKATFDAPEGNDPLTLDMGSMGKGQIWINGEGIGHQWPGYIARGICGECSYAGIYSENKCQANCEQPSQRWYHVPRSWLKPSGNLLVVFEEWGGGPAGVSLARRATSRVCADILKTYSSQGMDYHKELVETIMKVLAMSISCILHWERLLAAIFRQSFKLVYSSLFLRSMSFNFALISFIYHHWLIYKESLTRSFVLPLNFTLGYRRTALDSNLVQ
ncbi:Beta-galactosidase [Capsicum annuum]|uniref:beta-galactosidase n=1 Tax=Capsicum annuum TaxID=4072 RepID=A0A2G2Z3L8_CAPAN|nr:Beta-galactosidase [Capsicum annuum]